MTYLHKALNQAVKRNKARFPDDFMIKLIAAEVRKLNRSQNVTGSQKHRNPRFPPYAFTEHGILMLSSVLNSERAAVVNIEIMRAFVRLRQILASNANLARRLDKLESKYDHSTSPFRSIYLSDNTPPTYRPAPTDAVLQL